LVDLFYTGKYNTDKGTSHSYIQEYYPDIFRPFKGRECTVLEVGVFKGGSLKLWRDYLGPQAKIYGIDNTAQVPAKYVEGCKIILADAYTQEVADMIPELDIAIDDGLHTLEDHKEFIRLYSPKIKLGGYLIIEDIQNFDDVEEVMSLCPDGWRVNCIDLRDRKGRFDDVIIEFKRYDRYSGNY
jgi:23S rRNA U2552 (ribose-2'-O)-methylase RlmE/FtsJ